nr:immunoglobulin light chain junction region [Macaca mulatta]
CQHGYGSPLTF